MLSDTIYALSSGAPPSAIAIVRVSGSRAGAAVEALAGKIPPPRRATLSDLSDPSTGDLLDNALILFFPGPASATGEDLAELHLHGGRSVVRAVNAALSRIQGLREAQPGEFTRRAFENGRIDLSEAEGLADLLLSETESQRRAALAMAGGALSRAVAAWQDVLIGVAAQIEAALDFADEGDVEVVSAPQTSAALAKVVEEMRQALSRPAAERLRDGVRVAIAGPPNAGKSSLLNVLVGRQAAITSNVPGTTRDLIEAPAAIDGVPLLLMDTAGLRDSDDEIEAIGIGLAREAVGTADLVLWLGDPADAPASRPVVRIRAKDDLSPRAPSADYDVRVSALSGAGVEELIRIIVCKARELLPAEGDMALNARHRAAVSDAVERLEEAQRHPDLLVVAELIRRAKTSLGAIVGRSGVEEMLDALFGRFCIGK